MTLYYRSFNLTVLIHLQCCYVWLVFQNDSFLTNYFSYVDRSLPKYLYYLVFSVIFPFIEIIINKFYALESWRRLNKILNYNVSVLSLQLYDLLLIHFGYYITFTFLVSALSTLVDRGHLLFCFIHKLMQHWWKEWLQSPRTTTQSFRPLWSSLFSDWHRRHASMTWTR